jgi:hypothetical protein
VDVGTPVHYTCAAYGLSMRSNGNRTTVQFIVRKTVFSDQIWGWSAVDASIYACCQTARAKHQDKTKEGNTSKKNHIFRKPTYIFLRALFFSTRVCICSCNLIRVDTTLVIDPLIENIF